VSSEEALSRAEKLLEKVEETRRQLEQADDSAQAVEILSQLSELAKEVEAELSRARREAEAETDAGA
jgi:poly(A) polymerase Pap1